MKNENMLNGKCHALNNLENFDFIDYFSTYDLLPKIEVLLTKTLKLVY